MNTTLELLVGVEKYSSSSFSLSKASKYAGISAGEMIEALA
jgi:predicted HTH domain antitoxin